jgi:hypothetical protein
MFDQKCEDLARYFLGERAPQQLVNELAAAFQSVAEDAFAVMAAPADFDKGEGALRE